MPCQVKNRLGQVRVQEHVTSNQEHVDVCLESVVFMSKNFVGFKLFGLINYLVT